MFGYRKPADLPNRIPVFPLSGALVFPRGRMPLNIFEPRYLNMIDDALSGDRMIGMIQPASETEDRQKPGLAKVGTAARIVSFSETDDGRYLIVLAGICRFDLSTELALTSPYRQVEARYDRFAGDLDAPPTLEAGVRDRLVDALEDYLERNSFQADITAAEDAPMEELINAVCLACPFTLAEKQALLEAATLAERGETLIQLLAWGDSPQGDWLQ
jgi:uncharacterized protein